MSKKAIWLVVHVSVVMVLGGIGMYLSSGSIASAQQYHAPVDVGCKNNTCVTTVPPRCTVTDTCTTTPVIVVEETLTPVPTHTPTSTSTPLPTSTNTPTKTATPTNIPTSIPTATATPVPDTCGDSYEPDDEFSQAQPLAVGVEQVHHMCWDGDVDYIAIPLQANVTYRIETLDVQEEVDTRIALYAAAGTAPLVNAAGNGDQINASVVTFTPTTTATYYLRVDLALVGLAESNPPVQTYVVLASVK